MGSLDTMGLLGNSFIELAEHQPIEKISVSDIVAASGKNRKTFYYHFESKEHLIRWVFRRDLADVLKANVADDDLLFEPEGDDSFPSLPYYVHKKVGVRSLDGSVFFDMLAECFQYRRSYYAKTLRARQPTGLPVPLVRPRDGDGYPLHPVEPLSVGGKRPILVGILYGGDLVLSPA